MITAPTRPITAVIPSACAASTDDQDGSTSSNTPAHNPATAAPANDDAFAAITALAAVSGGTGLRVDAPVELCSLGRIRLRRPSPATASPIPTRAAANP